MTPNASGEEQAEEQHSDAGPEEGAVVGEEVAALSSSFKAITCSHGEAESFTLICPGYSLPSELTEKAAEHGYRVEAVHGEYVWFTKADAEAGGADR